MIKGIRILLKESAMQEREAEYCRFRNLKILISSWNIDSSKPSDLSGSSENQSFLQECITSVDSPDVLVFGWQEVIDLNNRKLTASTFSTRPDPAALRLTCSTWYRDHAVRQQEQTRRPRQCRRGLSSLPRLAGQASDGCPYEHASGVQLHHARYRVNGGTDDSRLCQVHPERFAAGCSHYDYQEVHTADLFGHETLLTFVLPCFVQRNRWGLW